jgi:hypothetical protein
MTDGIRLDTVDSTRFILEAERKEAPVLYSLTCQKTPPAMEQTDQHSSEEQNERPGSAKNSSTEPMERQTEEAEKLNAMEEDDGPQPAEQKENE